VEEDTMMTRTPLVSTVAASILFVTATVGAQPAASPAPASKPATAAQAATPPADTGRRPVVDIPKESLSAIRARGTLKACMAPYMPWVIEGATEGELTGFSVDLARQLAADLGVGIEFVGTGYVDLIPAVVEGDCDLIPAGLAATPDRALFVHFSMPVAAHDVQVVGPAATIGQARRAADLAQAGLTIGVVGASAELQDAKRLFPNASIQEFDGPGAVADALLSGKVALAVSVAPLPAVFTKLTGGKFVVLPEPLGVRGEAFAVRRGDLEFLAYLNTWVQARMYDGWLKDRADEWFVKMTWAEQVAKPLAQD
jgi:polar amino acid transport system substrate-binding protein